jgi:hypothetical protein
LEEAIALLIGNGYCTICWRKEWPRTRGSGAEPMSQAGRNVSESVRQAQRSHSCLQKIKDSHALSVLFIHTSIIMSSRTASRTLRAALKQAQRPAVQQQRTYLSAALNAARTTGVKQLPRASVAAQQVRGVKTVDFAGDKEQVFGKTDSQLTRNLSSI